MRFSSLRTLLLVIGAVAAGCDESPSHGAKVLGSGTAAALPVIAPKPPQVDPLHPRKTGVLDKALIRECSGFAASKKYPGVYWTLSDSGDSARLFAVTSAGKTVTNDAGSAFTGIHIKGARNVDWESLTIDASGRLIIGDFGNNLSARKDLCLYVLETEPDPAKASVTPTARKIPFYYADQKVVPDPMKNHDGEAIFCWRGETYVLTKEWRLTGSVLHRVDMTAGENTPKPTVPVCRFESHGMVTDAAISPDGTHLAVLTYTGVWLFDLPTDRAEKNPLSGRALYRPLVFSPLSWQVEAIAFTDDETLLIGNEEADLYRVKIDELSPAD